MTPKEKAKELFDKYCYAIKTEETDSGYFTNVIYAKQCALIAVNELSKTNPFEKDFIYNGNSYYWNEVKQEIELL